MAAAIAGLLILAVFLTSAVTVARSGLVGTAAVSGALQEATRLDGQQFRTEISFDDAAINTDDGNCNLTVTGDNTGAVSIVDFSMMDVIVQLTQGNNAPQSLEYTTGGTPSSAGDWAKPVTSASDKFELGLFNPGETMVIKAMLSLTVGGDTSGEVTVSTPDGVTDTATFSLTTPCP